MSLEDLVVIALVRSTIIVHVVLQSNHNSPGSSYGMP